MRNRSVEKWVLTDAESSHPLASSGAPNQVRIALAKNFEFSLPMEFLRPAEVASRGSASASHEHAGRLRLRFSLWQNHLPVDALPLEGWIELQLLSESYLMSMAY